MNRHLYDRVFEERDQDQFYWNTFLHDSIHEMEEKVVTSVMTEVLGRAPEKEDWKKVTRAFYDGVWDWYDLIYEDFKLGKVITTIFIDKVNITFKPNVEHKPGQFKNL